MQTSLCRAPVPDIQETQRLDRPGRSSEKAAFANSQLFTGSLESVVTAYVFTLAENNACQGILLQYDDGRSASFGHCRIGLDKCRVVQRPTRLHWAPVACQPSPVFPRFRGFYACFTNASMGTPISGYTNDWISKPMSGNLELWRLLGFVELRFVDQEKK